MACLPLLGRGGQCVKRIASGARISDDSPVSVDVSCEIVLNAPRAAVAEFAAHPDNATQWYKNINRVAWQSQPELVAGARVSFVAKFLGKELSFVYELAEYAPGEHLKMQMVRGPFPMETHYYWHHAGAGTRMVLRHCGEPGGVFRLAAPLLVLAMRHATNSDLQELKRVRRW